MVNRVVGAATALLALACPLALLAPAAAGTAAVTGHELVLPGDVQTPLLGNGTIRYPNNSIDDSFFNRCFMEYPPGVLNEIGVVIIHRYINPRSVAAALCLLILALPTLLFAGGRPVDAQGVRAFDRAKFAAVHFVHRINYAILLIVGLYVVFRQKRPCNIDGNQIGGFYGMPSGDAMGGALVAAFVLNRKWPSWIGCGLIILLVDTARVASGFHSVGMVIVGSVIGLALHYYSQYAPLWTIWIDTVVSTVGVAVALALDRTLVFGFDNQNNLWAWLAYGIGVQAFANLMIMRFVRQRGTGWRVSYKQIMRLYAAGATPIPHTDEEEGAGATIATEYLPIFRPSIQQRLYGPENPVHWNPDTLYTWMAFGVMIVFAFLAILIQVYDWIGIPGPGHNGGGSSPL